MTGLLYFSARFQTEYEKETSKQCEEVSAGDEKRYVERFDEFYDNQLKKYDPLLCSFENSIKARQIGFYQTNYENKYKEIVEESSNFSVSMLSLCSNQKEAQSLLTATKVKIKIQLSSDRMTVSFQFWDMANSNTCLPMLGKAIEAKNINFVSHDFSQQMLRELLERKYFRKEIFRKEYNREFFHSLYVFLKVSFKRPDGDM